MTLGQLLHTLRRITFGPDVTLWFKIIQSTVRHTKKDPDNVSFQRKKVFGWNKELANDFLPLKGEILQSL